MESDKPPSGGDGRKPYQPPELKEFGTVADLTASNTPSGPKNDGATKGLDKSSG